MTEVKRLLVLIESVDPSDTAAMDEIDARVHALCTNKTYKNHKRQDDALINEQNYLELNREGAFYTRCKEYSRSKEAQECATPVGWGGFILGDCSEFYGNLFTCDERERVSFESPCLPSLLLAGLYVVIQAIQYERKKGDKA